MVQHSDFHVVSLYKPRPFAFGFNQVLMAGELNILQYQFQIIYHGFIQAYF
jgi:recombinational DNA repair protein RecT